MRVIGKVTLVTGTPEQPISNPPGKPVTLDNEQGKALIKNGLARQASTGSSSANTTDDAGESSDADELLEGIVDAIADLSPESFGKNGKPSVTSLEAILGHSINSAQRDKAWLLYQSLTDDEAGEDSADA